MKLKDFLEMNYDCNNIEIRDMNNRTLAKYNGKDSIPKRFNNCFVNNFYAEKIPGCDLITIIVTIHYDGFSATCDPEEITEKLINDIGGMIFASGEEKDESFDLLKNAIDHVLNMAINEDEHMQVIYRALEML